MILRIYISLLLLGRGEENAAAMIHQVHLSKQTECNALCSNDECLVAWQEYAVHTESLHVERECLTNRFQLLHKTKSKRKKHCAIIYTRRHIAHKQPLSSFRNAFVARVLHLLRQEHKKKRWIFKIKSALLSGRWGSWDRQEKTYTGGKPSEVKSELFSCPVCILFLS